MAKTNDLSPKLKGIKPASSTLNIPPLNIPIGQLIGGLSMYANSFKRGAGDQIFGSDSRGIWLGAADFDDAPFRVYMDGRVFLQAADGSITLDTVNKRILVNDGTNDRVLVGYLLNGF